ncbi:YqxA family protein [Siminovitchia sediminis]|uniref:YqxA family protein n=1 Tax=Siminovitchia sediminis TaxID=1274353 RepID=A0ABW4KB92_9BACI
MGKFIGKCLIVVLVLFIGVFIGMEKAHQGMQNMKGYEEPSLPSPVSIHEGEDGQIEAEVLGSEIQHADQLSKKKEDLEKIGTFNIFSSMGKALASFVREATDALIQFFLKLFSS